MESVKLFPKRVKIRLLLLGFILLAIFPSNNLNNSVGFREVSGIVLPLAKLEREKQCLIHTLWHEARGEGEEGMKAVLSVIYNRKQHPKYPSTWCGVVEQPWQFSFLNALGHKIPRKALKTPVEPSEKKALGVAMSLANQAVYGAFTPSLPVSVVYYHHTKVNPKWSRKLKKAAIIQSHVFFHE